jgi:N-acetylglutamate synthase
MPIEPFSPSSIETAGLLAWPALQTVRDRSWVLRAANGYTKRSNSVQSLDPNDIENAPDRLNSVLNWFAARALPPVFRVTPLLGAPVLELLEQKGWTAFDHSHVLAMPLPADLAPDPRASFGVPTAPEWIEAQRELQGYGEKTLSGLRGVVGAITTPAAGVLQRDAAGAIVASALMVLADGYAIAGNVVTAPSARGRGHARALMRSALAWAAERGATAAALNVQADNAAALKLYASLGYSHQYDYHYRRPGAA